MRASLLPLYERASTDVSLSAKSRGIVSYLLVTYSDALPTSTELAQVLPEGRDAIRTAYRELVDKGYLVRYRVPLPNKAYRTETHFAGQDGFSGAREGVPLSNTQSLITNGVLTIPNTYGVRGANAPESESEMWVQTDDESPGEAFGKIVDEPEAKTKKPPRRTTKVTVQGGWSNVPKTRTRYDKAKEKWTTGDLVGHFVDQVEACAPGVIGQARPQVLGTTLKSWLSKGISPEVIFTAMEMFFADAKNVRNAGDGQPLWLRFKIFYEDNQGKASRRTVIGARPIEKTIDRVMAGEYVTHGKLDF